VRVAGVKIGSVVGFTLNPENFQANVVMELDPAVKLTEDATAKVTAEGLLGSKFISLEQGGAETILAEGDFISNTQGAVDIWSLISQAMFENKGGAGGSTPETQTP
jgi:phospholipid/cholesterol/gamma-HCH transport system substrate-binding protein